MKNRTVLKLIVAALAVPGFVLTGSTTKAEQKNPNIPIYLGG